MVPDSKTADFFDPKNEAAVAQREYVIHVYEFDSDSIISLRM